MNTSALTLSQAKAGLISAAKQGLIDGSELTESWFSSLKRDIFRAIKEKKPKSSKDEKKTKKTDKTKSEPPAKKTPPTASGFVKFIDHFKSLELEFADQLSTAGVIGFCTVEQNRRKLLELALANSWIDTEGNCTVEDFDEVYTVCSLSEEEKKSARAWFPHFFMKKTFIKDYYKKLFPDEASTTVLAPVTGKTSRNGGKSLSKI
jgi:uncharacterized protein YdaU (DUF1376 family)